jgi:predicted nucleic acid-binding protein
VLTLGEIRKGIVLLQDRDPSQAEALEDWLTHVKRNYAGRILSVNADISEVWDQMHYTRNVPVVDGLLAATAEVHDLTLVTRNIEHVQGLGASLLNPFEPATGEE